MWDWMLTHPSSHLYLHEGTRKPRSLATPMYASPSWQQTSWKMRSLAAKQMGVNTKNEKKKCFLLSFQDSRLFFFGPHARLLSRLSLNRHRVISGGARMRNQNDSQNTPIYFWRRSGCIFLYARELSTSNHHHSPHTRVLFPSQSEEVNRIDADVNIRIS